MERTASIRIASFAEYACESTPNFPPLYQPSKRIIRTQRLTGSLMSLRSTILADWKAIFPESVRPHLDGPVGYAVLGAVGLVALLVLLLVLPALWRALSGGGGKSDEGR